MDKQTTTHSTDEHCDYCNAPIREGDLIHWLTFAIHSNLVMPDIPYKLRGNKQVPVSLACDKCWNNPNIEIVGRTW